jgi:hypothetical protein
MTDRELLEAAAKVAGLVLVPYTWNKGTGWDHEGFTVAGKGPNEWNPLESDEEAFRLAVMLRLDIFMAAPGSPDATVEVIAIHGKDEAPFAIEALDGGDPYAATRRAIVRAAATMAPSEQK